MALVIATDPHWDFTISMEIMDWIRTHFPNELFDHPGYDEPIRMKYGGHSDLEAFFARNPSHPVVIRAVQTFADDVRALGLVVVYPSDKTSSESIRALSS
jgi:hypothetical protein